MNREIYKAVKRVLDSGKYILGEEGEKLEKEVAQFLGVKYAVGVSSGTSALVLALRALGVGKGDSVITTPFTFIATAGAIVEVGATPVFVDIGEDKNINADFIETVIWKNTKAILPVHLFGKSCDMGEITKIARKHKLFVVEDMAQAFGLPLRGDIDCLSFYPAKILGACGDAGMVITNRKWIADKVRLLRNHGMSEKKKYWHTILGTNARLDEIQAAILRVRLKHFAELKKGFKYDEGKYYPYPLHLQPCFAYLGYKKGDFPNAEREAEKVRPKK